MSELWRSGSGGWNRNAKVRVSRLAARQWGRVSAAQLTRLGISKAGIARWVREAYLHRVLPSVYAVGHSAPTVEGDLSAALLYAGPGAMLSHATALWWLGLIDARPRPIEVSTPRRCRSLRALRVHDRRALPGPGAPGHGSPGRIWHRGLPVTTVVLALRDYAATASLDRLRRVIAEAEYRRLLDVEAVRAVLGRGLPGSARLREAVENHQPRLALTRSVLEERFLALCESAGLPLPECNSTIAGLMVDMLWRLPRVIVELDGHAAHGTRAQIERDRGRELRLRAAGFHVLRYTWRQITTEPQLVIADLTAALERAPGG
jgi:hypothetical protein